MKLKPEEEAALIEALDNMFLIKKSPEFGRAMDSLLAWDFDRAMWRLNAAGQAFAQALRDLSDERKRSGLRWARIAELPEPPAKGGDYLFRDDGGVWEAYYRADMGAWFADGGQELDPTDGEVLCHPDGTPAEIPTLPETP